MNESDSIETTDRTNLTDQTKFRLSGINKIENYFNKEIKERKLNSTNVSKYAAAFDYIDKILIALSATLVEHLLFLYWSSCRNSKCKILLFLFSLTTEIIKKLLSITRNK